MKDGQTEILAKPTLLGAEPQLFVADVQGGCDFYTKQLGFTLAFTYGEPPFYGQVFRDGARLNLRHLDEPAIRPRASGERASALSVHHGRRCRNALP